jgi:hypothetical protein
MSQAALANPQRMDGIEFNRFGGKHSVADDSALSIRRAAGLIEQLPATVPVFLSVIGGFHNMLGLVRSDVDFDFLPDFSAVIGDLDVAEIIPWRAMADTFDFYIEPASKYLPVKQAARGPVFLIGAPPPKESDAFIMKRFAKSGKQDYRGRNVIEIGLNSPRIRKKLWDLECSRSKKWAEDRGVIYLPAPAESFDDRFFLKECYYEDATHANLGYGILVLEQILDIIKSCEEDVAHG